MKRTGACAAVLAAAAMAMALVATGGAQAHHSFAMFDYKNRITLVGTVESFGWTNPHAYIKLAIPDGQGGVKHYTVECASPNVLTRVGWKFNSIKPGDRVSLLINPLKNGEPGGMLQEATLADGRVLSDSNPPDGSFD
jgi:hypothetical protein